MKLLNVLYLLLALKIDISLACNNANSCVNQFKLNVQSACLKDLACQCQSYQILVATCFTGCTKKEDVDFKDSVQNEVNSVCNGKDSDSDNGKSKKDGKDKNKDNDKDSDKDDDKNSKGTPTTIKDKDKDNTVTRTTDDSDSGFGSATLIIDNGPTGIAIPIQGDPKRQGSVTISLSNTPIAVSKADRNLKVYTGALVGLTVALYTFLV